MAKKKNNTGKSGPLKLIAKIIIIAVSFFLVLVIGISIAIMVIVDKPFIEGQMANALHRQVSIGEVSVSIFSVLSGIEVKDVAISNFKNPEEIKALSGKQVPAGDRFVSLKSFNFKIAFGPLLKKQFVLKELVLNAPAANIIRYKNGLFNFSDLLVSKPLTKEEQAELEKKKAEEAKKAKEKLAEGPSKPLSVDDIPIRITVGKVGVEKGNINFTDQSTGQQLSIYDLTAKVYDIEIDPANLDKSDLVKIQTTLGIKTIGQVSNGSVKTFDISLSIDGNVIPFDHKTRLLNPEITLKAGSPRGTATGLQIFDKAKSVGALDKYCGKLDFLKDDIKWSDAFISVWYKDNLLKFSDGKIKTEDFAAFFSGQLNTASMGVDATSSLTLAAKHTATVRSKLTKNIDKIIVGKARSVVKADKLTDAAMKPLLVNDSIFLQYAIKGTLSKPNVDMVAPKLPALKDLVKDAAGGVVDAAKDKAKEEAQKKVDAGKDKAADKAKDEAKKKLKKPKL